jgi:type VI protein secretion system component Hcp
MSKSVALALGAVIGIALLWPVVSNARGGGSHGAQHNDLTITKSSDKSSPKMMQQTTSGQAKSREPKLTPEKVEAGSENVRR